MTSDMRDNVQPLRELKWLSSYFKNHSREDLALEIFEQVKRLRHQAQKSLIDDASEVIDFSRRQRKRKGGTK